MSLILTRASARSFASRRCQVFTPVKSELGFSLLEVTIAIVLLGILAVGFMTALGTASKVLFVTDEKETMKNLAESQMEYINQQPYSPSGTYVAAAVPAGYSGFTVQIPPAVTLSSANATVHMQQVTVIVSRDNRQFTLVDYKVSR